MRSLLTSAGLFLAMAASTSADILLDQQYNFSSSFADSTNGNVSEVGQTFTVGIAGTLSSIDVLMFRLSGIFDPTGPAVLKVYNTTGGNPTGAPLTSVSKAKGDISLNVASFATFDVSAAGILVNVGDKLSFGISAPGSEVGPYFLPTTDSPGYAGGNGVNRIINPVGAWQLSQNFDHGFKTVVITAVPEPCSLVLLFAGGMSVACRRRRRSIEFRN